MTEFILWFTPLVIFMLSPALLPILIHTCGHLYDKLRPTAHIQNSKGGQRHSVVLLRGTATTKGRSSPH